MQRTNKCLQLSKDFLSSIKHEKNIEEYLNNLKLLDYDSMLRELDNDNRIKTFWINIYNSFVKLRLRDKNNAKIYPKWEFFEKTDICITNLSLSFDDIEHKILRKSQIKFSRGYLSRFSFFIPN